MSKLPHVGTTIFTTMSKMAAEYDAINLSQGFPNFPVDPRLIDAMESTIKENVHQYTPMTGHPVLINEICNLIENQYSRKVSSENVLITAGATQAIFTTILALVESGDEVVILDPCYDCYDPAVTLAGGIPVHIPLNEEFKPDWGLIENSITSKTRMIITNNPHNPSGTTWSQKDLEALRTIVQKNPRLVVLSDEVYEFITFEQKHLSCHQYSDLYDRTITVSSFGKTFHITGWKIGYLVAEGKLMTEIKKVHQYNVFCVNSISQHALSKYLKIVDVRELGNFYKNKRDLFADRLSDSKFELIPSNGTYFQLAKYDQISNHSDVDFCEWLTKGCGVAAIPVSVFSENPRMENYIRFCFAKDDDTLIKATDLLCNL